jgi:hypothetical protein
MKYLSIPSILLSLFIFVGCNESNNSAEFPDVLSGTYNLSMETDSMAVDFTVEFVTAVDSAVYGYIESETVDYEAPIGLDSLTTDSLYFRTYTHHLALSRSDNVMDGEFDFFDTVHPATMTKQSDDVRSSLLATREQLPLNLDIQAKGMAWAAPLSGDRTYLVNDDLIYLAEKEGDVWKSTFVEYDTTAWDFYSIGLSPDQNRLLAHGVPKTDAYAHEGGGDYYMLTLDTPTSVGDITHLPSSVNTDSYDIFPAFTPNGDILLSTWGKVEGLDQAGRGDLYLAEVDGENYTVRPITEGLNTEQPEAGVSMGPNGDILLFHRSDRDLGLPDRIFKMEKTDSEWSEPEVVGPPVTRDFTYTYGGRIDPTGEYLFFNSGFRGQTEIFRIPISEIPDLAKSFSDNDQ